MHKRYFADYGEAINGIYQAARTEYEKTAKALTDMREYAAEVAKNRNLLAEKKMLVAAQLREAEREYKVKVAQLREKTEAKFQQLRADFLEDTRDFTKADSSRVDTAAISLIQSGAIAEGDLTALAERFWNNPTMLKVVLAACKQGERTDEKRILESRINEYINPEIRRETFDNVTSIAMMGIREEQRLADGINKLWNSETKQAIEHDFRLFDDGIA